MLKKIKEELKEYIKANKELKKGLQKTKKEEDFF